MSTKLILPGRAASTVTPEPADARPLGDGLVVRDDGVWQSVAGVFGRVLNPPYSKKRGQPGYMVPEPGMGGTTTGALTAARLTYGRFVPDEDITPTRLDWLITTASAVNDPIEVGIMDATVARVYTTGAILGKTNVLGLQTTAFTPGLLLAGVPYYIAVVQATVGGAAASFHTISFSNASAADLFGATAGARVMGFQSATPTIPANGALTTSTNAMPLFALRDS